MRYFWLGILVGTMMLVACGDDDSDFAQEIVDPSTVVKDIMTDSRDGKTYKTVQIGDQIWMAENLNYETENSYCYNDSIELCEKFGRLYTWADAMDSIGIWTQNGYDCGNKKNCKPIYPVRGVCPRGWHLPTKAEFEILFSAVDGLSTDGAVLKSTSGWEDYRGKIGNGTDVYSFAVLPAGYGGLLGFNQKGYGAYFWSSTETEIGDFDNAYLDALTDVGIDANTEIASCAYGVDFQTEFSEAGLDIFGKSMWYSVRCVKD